MANGQRMKITTASKVKNLLVTVLLRVVGSHFSPWSGSILMVDKASEYRMNVGMSIFVFTGSHTRLDKLQVGGGCFIVRRLALLIPTKAQAVVAAVAAVPSTLHISNLPITQTF